MGFSLTILLYILLGTELVYHTIMMLRSDKSMLAYGTSGISNFLTL